jgi:diguanylate cyclase (GGDEF)-like protein/PAS domain S-box-containing protein
MVFADRNKEERFLAQLRDDTASHLGWACLLGAAIMIGFIWQDTLMSASGYKAINIRLFGALPVSALAWYLSRNLGVRRFISYSSAFFWLSYACFTISIFIVYEPGPYGLTSSAGLGSFLLILFGVFAFSNLRFWSSLLVGLLILLVYTVSVALWTEVAFVDFIMGDFLTAVALLIGAAVKTLFTERARRRQFETSEQLSESYNTVEQQVRERTSELTDEITNRKHAEQELMKSEEKFRLITENMVDCVALVDTSGTYQYVTPSYSKTMGYAPEDMIGSTGFSLTHPDDLERVFKLYMEGYEQGLVETNYETRLRHKNGHYVPMEIVVRLLKDPQGGKKGAVLAARDITQRRQLEQERRNAEEQYRALVENASDIIFRTDNTGHFTFVNPAALRIAGYEEEEVMGMHYPELIRPDMRNEAIKFFGRQFIKGLNNTYSEYPIISKDGHEVWLGQNTQLIVEDGNITGFQSVARDITDRKRIREALQESENRYRELSIVDDLTQLYNSRYFYHQLKTEMDRADRYKQPLTLLLLDLDDFKQFNDAYGHVEGDQVLMRLGQVVKRCLRQTDSSYRYGGEEFTILLPMTTSKDAAVTAERIRMEFNEENFSPVPGQDVYLTMSIGLAQYNPKEDMKAFVHRVDQLMYQGKKNGKNRVCCEA